MTAGRRRSMEEFLQQQRVMEPDDRDRAAQTEKMLRTLQRAASRGTLQAAAHADPETVRRMIASVRSILDAIEQEAF